MNRKKIIIICFILFVLLLLIIIINNNKTEYSDKSFNNISNDLIYDYDKTNEIYKIYDNEGNVRGETNDKVELKKFIDNPDYNENDAPSDLKEYDNDNNMELIEN